MSLRSASCFGVIAASACAWWCSMPWACASWPFATASAASALKKATSW
jgi:hypothetical protein